MISIPEIIEATAVALGHEPAEIVTAAKGALLARHVAIYLARTTTTASLPTIAGHFQRDHTTILYVVNKITAEIKTDPRMAALVSSLTEELRYRAVLNRTRSLDVLSLAERIAVDPVRASYRVSVDEIIALATACRDLWEVGRAADQLARLCVPGATNDDMQKAALCWAITEELAAIGGAATPIGQEKH